MSGEEETEALSPYLQREGAILAELTPGQLEELYPEDRRAGMLRAAGLAVFFGVTDRTVRAWRRRADFPAPNTCGRWNVLDIKQWLEERAPVRDGRWRGDRNYY